METITVKRSQNKNESVLENTKMTTLISVVKFLCDHDTVTGVTVEAVEAVANVSSIGHQRCSTMNTRTFVPCALPRPETNTENKHSFYISP
jgi:hypothetical protein